MKRLLILTAVLLCGMITYSKNKPGIIYTDGSTFPLYGKAIEETSARYERLPASYEEKLVSKIWELSRNSAGLYLRFRSDSPEIWVRWESTFANLMNHQTATGTRGLDLYTIDSKGNWTFVNSARPDIKERTNNVRIIGNMKPEMREYMLYLSLYDGITSIEIGTVEGYVIEAPAVDRPLSSSPVVMYGTSILQGGCANRPGMAHTAIISRALDREVINLGFSGSAHLEPELAELMARIENPAVFVLDYVPNATVEEIDSLALNFFRIIREAHPDVPLIFVEDPDYPYARFDMKMRAEIDSRNARQRALYESLKGGGEKLIWYVSNEGMLGEDAEATVDGIHFTDLGMMRYAGHLLPVIREAIREAGK